MWPLDEQGAVLVMAVFMSVFLVAMLYFVVGVGEAVFRREGLGDAADASAFAAAILHARGMNLIAFINLVMAALLAVLVAVRVVQAVFVVGIVVCVAIAYPTYGVSLGYVQPLANAAKKFGDLFEKLKDPIFQALEALHQAQRVTSYVVPAIAVLDSAREASQSHPPAVAGVALPGALRLPVEPDSFEVLCGKAGHNVGTLATLPLGNSFPLVSGALADAAESLAASSSSFFCGDGGSQPPTYTSTQDVTYPQGDVAACDGPDASEADCRDAQRELEQAKPQERTGDCQAENCGLGGPYERYAREARSACRPRSGFMPYEYVWQEREVAVEYTFHTETGWLAGRHQPAPPQLMTHMFPPCGPQGDIAEGWNLEPHPEGLLEQLTPLCAETSEPPRTKGYAGEVRSVPHTEVTHLFSCTVSETKTEEPMQGEQPLSDSDGKEPHRVLKDAQLGDNLFQLRGLVWGETPDDTAERVVKLATWGSPTTDTLGALGFDALENIAVAQAEYYYDHDGSEAPSEWLWNLKWTARLVRFRLPTSESDGEKSESQEQWEADSEEDAGAHGGLGDVSNFGALCSTAGSEDRCGALDGAAGTLDGLILH